MITTHAEYLTEVAKVEAAAKAYYDSDTLKMSDAEYDSLVDNIEAAGQAFGWTEGDAVLNAVAAGASAGGDVSHAIPMLSLGKLKTVSAINQFVANQSPAKVVFEPKLDGLAISATYKQGKLVQVATRGDGHSGENITANAMKALIKGLPHDVLSLSSFEVRGEVFIGGKDFIAAQVGRKLARGDQFANPRNAVAGSLRTSKDTSYVKMTFGIYDAIGVSESDSYSEDMRYLRTLGFIPAMSLVPAAVSKLANLEEIIVNFGTVRSTLDAPTDGSVVKFDSYAVRAKLGSASRHPRWAVAFKYEAEIAETILVDIVREVGRTGAISYVGIVNPVTIEESVVSRATLNNSEFIANLDLRIGDTVFIRKANGIIPEINSVNLSLRPSRAVPYEAPKTCPKCGDKLDTTTSIVWRCTNPEDAIGSLISYAMSRDILDVDGLSTAIVDALLDSTLVSDIADVFTLTVAQLTNVKVGVSPSGADRFIGAKVAEKLFANLQKARQQPLNRIISALGIRMMGRTFGRRLMTHFGSMEKIQKATLADFLHVEGAAEGRANEFVKGFRQNAPLIAKLKAAGFTALQPQAAASASTVASASPVKAGKLQGLKVLVTGAVEGYTRGQVGELVESLGGISSSSVSSKLDLVVVGPGAGGSAAKATALGIKIISAADFLVFIK